MIEDLVAGVNDKLQMKNPKELPLSELAYHPPAIHAAMEKRTFEEAKCDFPKRRINEALCTRCGLCQERCPADAVACEPHRQAVKEKAPARAKLIAEGPRTQMFL